MKREVTPVEGSTDWCCDYCRTVFRIKGVSSRPPSGWIQLKSKDICDECVQRAWDALLIPEGGRIPGAPVHPDAEKVKPVDIQKNIEEGRKRETV